MVQQAIAQVLTPIFEPTFSDSSFGFRPGRNAHRAIKQVQAYVKDGYRVAVDLDLAKFFDTLPGAGFDVRSPDGIRDGARALPGPGFHPGYREKPRV